jgi:hypothetical protein
MMASNAMPESFRQPPRALRDPQLRNHHYPWAASVSLEDPNIGEREAQDSARFRPDGHLFRCGLLGHEEMCRWTGRR